MTYLDERMATALRVALLALALALFVAIGGDGDEPARHEAWMHHVKEQGAWVMW